MFRREEIEEYKHVKAPEGLRRRIMSATVEREYAAHKNIRLKRTGREIAVLAACLGLAAASVVSLSRLRAPSATLSVKKQVISEDSVQMACYMTREAVVCKTSVDVDGLELELDTSNEVTLSAGSGTLYLVDEETKELIASGTVCRTERACTVYWEVLEEATPCELTLTGQWGGKHIYVLTQQDGGWEIYLK